MLSRQAVLDYQQIYKEEFGESISYELASEKATKFLYLFGIIYRPIPLDWIKGLKDKEK